MDWLIDFPRGTRIGERNAMRKNRGKVWLHSFIIGRFAPGGSRLAIAPGERTQQNYEGHSSIQYLLVRLLSSKCLSVCCVASVYVRLLRRRFVYCVAQFACLSVLPTKWPSICCPQYESPQKNLPPSCPAVGWYQLVCPSAATNFYVRLKLAAEPNKNSSATLDLDSESWLYNFTIHTHIHSIDGEASSVRNCFGPDKRGDAPISREDQRLYHRRLSFRTVSRDTIRAGGSCFRPLSPSR